MGARVHLLIRREHPQRGKLSRWEDSDAGTDAALPCRCAWRAGRCFPPVRFVVLGRKKYQGKLTSSQVEVQRAITSRILCCKILVPGKLDSFRVSYVRKYRRKCDSRECFCTGRLRLPVKELILNHICLSCFMNIDIKVRKRDLSS